MEALLNLNNKKYQNIFILKHNLSRGLTLNYTNNQEKAIDLLENSIIKKHTDTESLLDIYLCLYSKGRLKKSQPNPF